MPQRPRLYPNEAVKRIIAFIPRGHLHTRLILELEDQAIILQEATVAAIVRAYASVALHPTRRATELASRRLPRGERKPLYAEHQLLETGRSEDEILDEAEKALAAAQAAADTSPGEHS